MPTPRGWGLAVFSLAAAAGGRLLGLRELFVIGAGAGALVVAALVYVWARQCSLRSRRVLSPGRARAGSWTAVELSFTNPRRRATPPLSVSDGTRSPFVLAPVGPRETVRVTYPYFARRRGIVPVGPLHVRLTDPFGVASRVVGALGPSNLTVHPATEEVTAPPASSGTARPHGFSRPALSPLEGEDFHSLRPYQDGDDFRRVHWPTTARLDELVVRLDDVPRASEVVVALDLRDAVHDAATLEHAVSAAASVLAASCRDEGLVRLVTTGGLDSAMAGGERHLESIFDHLAAVSGDRSSDLRAVASAIGHAGDATFVIVTTTAVSAGDLDMMARMRRVSGVGVAVVMAAGDRPPAAAALRFPVEWTVVVGAGEGLAAAWERSVGSASVGLVS